MTIKVARLMRLLPGLTMEERLDAILARYREDLPPERSLGASVPEGDAWLWNRVTGLLNATHVQLGWYIEYVEATVTQLELRQGMLSALQYAGLAMDDHLVSIAVDPKDETKRGSLRKRQERLDEMSEELARRMAEELAGRWMDVRLAEEGSESLALECWGRDLVHPEVRAKLADCKSRLLALKEGLKFWVECELPEPDDAQVERLLELLEREAER